MYYQSAKRGRKWTPGMEQVLRERFADTPTQVLADELGLTYRQVAGKACMMGLRKSPAYAAEHMLRFAKPTRWTPAMEARVREAFPTMLTDELAAELGLSVRTVIRKARAMGVYKSDTFREDNREEIVWRLRLGQMTGRPNLSKFRPGNHSGRPFQPGRAMTPEQEERKRLHCQETSRRLAEDERTRIAAGLPQKTRWKFGRESPAVRNRRYQLRRRGYIVPGRGGHTAYYTPETRRSARYESLKPGDKGYIYFEFAPIEKWKK